MKGPGFGMDERTRSIVQRVCAVLYVLSMAALWIDLVVREFVLGLPVSGYDDIAMIFTANVLLFIGAVLYYGVVIVPRIRPVKLAAIYGVMVLLGTAFAAVKHGSTSVYAILGHLRIVAAILGIMAAAYALLAYVGHRKIERRITS
ncbi:MAG TPA: hypothetical protein VFA33_19475 [Bryobacteraceae bacterium]|nr:hypothetical protein [Bryobacteraceae bacterium]